MSIYKIVDKTSGELIYIGQTRGLSVRIQYHYAHSLTRISSPLYNYIKSCGGWANMDFIVLAEVADTRRRIYIENCLQHEFKPKFYWICKNTKIPSKMSEVFEKTLTLDENFNILEG